MTKKDPLEEELNVVDEIHQPITERKEDNWTSLSIVVGECDRHSISNTAAAAAIATAVLIDYE